MEGLQDTKLFSELKLKNIILKNRIVWLPHYNALPNIDSTPSENDIYYYAERSKGGAGLIVAGNYAVDKTGQMHRTFAIPAKRESIKNFTIMASRVHQYGAKIIGQLTHAGPTKMERNLTDLWSPSQVIEGSTGLYTMELDKHDIKDLIGFFKDSSKNLLYCGFDGIELKVAHDGILRAFISPYYNKRTDQYGGSFKNMARILVEISTMLREMNSEMPIGIRLCMDEFEDEGYNLEYAIEVAKYLENLDLIDYVSIDAGTTYQSFIMQIPPMSFVLGCMEYMSAALKKEVKIPVIAFGRINDPLQAEQILQNESADLIGMARQLICDPETPNKSLKGHIDDIRKCIGCVDGCLAEVMKQQPVKCIQNPAVGIEKEYGIGTLKKAKILKKVVAIGGGVAGMKAAEICAKRGHSVVLFEKCNELGGQINILRKIPFRNEFTEVVRYLEIQVKNNKNIDIRMGIEANKKAVLEEAPDVVIVATGAESFMPNEFKDAKTFSSWDVLSDRIEPQGKVIIYDLLGKSEGIGVAEYIMDNNSYVEVLFYTPMHNAGQDVNFLNLNVLYRKLFHRKFTVYPNYGLTSINNGTAIFKKAFSKSTKTENNYDYMIVTGNAKSNFSLFKELDGSVEELYRIGDARAPREVLLAIKSAEELARII